MYEELFYNKDGSLRQDVIDSMDRYFADEDHREQEYITKYFARDEKIIREYLKDHESIDTYTAVQPVWDDKEQKWDYTQSLGTYDINMFCRIAKLKAEEFDYLEPSEFTAYVGAYNGLILELVVGQGSFWFITLDKRDPSWNFGAGI